MVFSSVNIFEILYASTYGNYNYIYKVKKNATASVRPPAAARRGWSERLLRALVHSHALYQKRRRVLVMVSSLL